ncbi:MAG: helix-turn-helix domain-containing protein [Acidobacteria bacterium]|nr:helix-turn-helix domain-containing protein [Acidobacteriota bacterium]
MLEVTKKNREMCPDCGKEAPVVHADYPFAECGMKNVMLMGIKVIRCKSCGDSPILSNLQGLLRSLALGVVKKPMRLNGTEVRYLRKRLGKTGVEFSRLIHVDPSTLSKWENGDDPVGEQSDRLIRMITIVLDPELNNEQKGVVEAFPSIRKRRAALRVRIDTSDLSCQYA